jgi:hypothetical protein
MSKPSHPGFFWVKWPMGDEPEIERVVRRDDDGVLCIRLKECLINIDDLHDNEWWGPEVPEWNPEE